MERASRVPADFERASVQEKVMIKPGVRYNNAVTAFW